jgi:hypothetical protein
MNIKELAEQCHKTDGWPDYLEFDYKKFAELVEAQTRARCIELVLAGSAMPIQTRTLEALQRDRKRIAALIEEDGK